MLLCEGRKTTMVGGGERKTERKRGREEEKERTGG